MRIRAGIGAVALVVTLAACATTTSGTGKHKPVPAPHPSTSETSRGLPTAATASAPPPPSSAPVTVPITSAAPSTAPVSSEATAPADVERVLLTAGDVGHGFTAAPDNATATAPLPCTPNDPPIDQQVPSEEHGGVDLTKDSAGAEVSEMVALYATLGEAVHLQTSTERGLACSGGKLSDGEQVTLSGPTDISSILTPHTDKAEAWSIRTAKIKGALVLVRLHRVIVQFAFFKLIKGASNPHINSKQILEMGLAKVINGG